MSSMTHRMRKRLSKATTRQTVIEKSISAEYVSGKKRLQREKQALKEALKDIESIQASWKQLATQHKDFAELIETEAGADGKLHTQAANGMSQMRSMHAEMIAPIGKEEASVKMIGHVKAYMTELEAIEKEFKQVETHFTETQRYERKVAKLSDKGKESEKTQRNVNKLEGARAVFQGALDSLVERMERSSGKFEPVLQCVMTAFWMRQHKFATIYEKCGEMRTLAAQVSNEMIAMDVSKSDVQAIVVGKTEQEVEKTAAPQQVAQVPIDTTADTAEEAEETATAASASVAA